MSFRSKRKTKFQHFKFNLASMQAWVKSSISYLFSIYSTAWHAVNELFPGYLWNGEHFINSLFIQLTQNNTIRYVVFLSSQCIDKSDNENIHVHRDYNLKIYSLPNFRQPVRQYQGVCSFVWITSVISSKYIYWKWEKSTVVSLPATTAGQRMATQLRFHSNRCLSFGKCIIICNILKCQNKNMSSWQCGNSCILQWCKI